MSSQCERHEWATQLETENYICTQCPAVTDACHTCGNNPAWLDKACDKCLKWTRNILADIREALDHPMAPILPIRAIRYDQDTSRSATDFMPFGIGQNLDDPDDLAATAATTGKEILQLTRDPNTMTDALRDWAEAWAEHRSETTPGDWLAYLSKLTVWAANNPDTSGWHDYHRDARLIRARLRHLVGLAPQKEFIPCPFCGATLQRHWTDHGLADEIRCTNRDCERQTSADLADLYWIASTELKQAPIKHSEKLITLREAPPIFPDVPEHAWWKWKERNEPAARTAIAWQKALERGHYGPAPEPPRIPTAGTNRRGEFLYRIADLATRVQQWRNRSQTRKRRQTQKLAS